LDLDSKIKKALEKYENKSKALFKAKVRKIAAAVGIPETDPRFNEDLQRLILLENRSEKVKAEPLICLT